MLVLGLTLIAGVWWGSKLAARIGDGAARALTLGVAALGGVAVLAQGLLSVLAGGFSTA